MHLYNILLPIMLKYSNPHALIPHSVSHELIYVQFMQTERPSARYNCLLHIYNSLYTEQLIYVNSCTYLYITTYFTYYIYVYL